MMCNSFIIAGLLDLSAFPVLSAHVFFCRFFRTQVFLRVCLDVIRYIMTLFCSIVLASVESGRYYLKASGRT